MFSVLRVALGAMVLAGILVSLTGPVAAAHVPTTDGTSTIRQDGSLVRYELELDYDTFTKAAGLGRLPRGAQDAEREAFLESHRARLTSYLADRLTVSLDGAPCAAELDDTGITKRQKFLYARLLLIHRCPGSGSGEFTVRYGVFSEADAIGAEHTNMVDYELGGSGGSDVFDAGNRELRVGRSDAGQRESRAGETGFLSSTGRFVAMGLEHILLGIDHVLFLVLLLLGAQGWRSVVRLATSFTVAHSVTLALAVLGWVEVPAEIVEPLIALSIVYVAVENIARGESRHRVLVVFGFGLLHGLGFAGALSFTDDFTGRLLVSLLSFNLGIELGQLAIVLLVFPLLLLARRYSWSTVAHIGATGVVGVVGLAWFVERLLAPGGAA
ncbi:HupE/UreJ family protein [Streptomyces sp. PKU-EA00015]|uniref:HupE/UreJ family protein n=1 Tax=Streptomyces sp. PKU-EA00015 TaxID=2748326 RepID=UPI0015A1476E|nr:HupE/UreJ family protein [Streptomyces sp. PKU-EA00015]NWF25749.1 HupE/UreJ family protein [Streptomyces sp. PKU-EA00015]